MDKTLHKKLTVTHFYEPTQTFSNHRSEEMLAGLAHEMLLLREAAKDLLQPRPEAVAGILMMARSMQ